MGLALIAALMAGLGVLLLFWGLAQVVSSPARAIEERLDKYGAREAATFVKEKKEPEKAPRLVKGLDQAITRRGFGENIARELARADLKLTVSEYIAFNFISIIICGLIAFALYRSPIMGVAGAVVGLYLPRFYVRQRQQRRLNAFNEQLGDAINLLSNSLRSGYSLLQAMETVAKELPPPISVEFSRVVQEVGLGLSIQQALNNMLRRIRSDDLELIITAINIQHEVGGNLAEILDNISYTIRERVRIKGEIRVLTAQQRLTAYIIGFLPLGLGLFLHLINPEYIGSMFQEPCGWIMLGTGFFMMVTGFMIMRRITSIEV